MNTREQTILEQSAHPLSNQSKVRLALKGHKPTVLADIYKEKVNISVWQRSLSQKLQASVKEFLGNNQSFASSQQITANNIHSNVKSLIGQSDFPELSNDVALLVDMYCCLFDLKNVGARLRILDKAMCPRFHVDNVPCRLVTTYQGIATQWLPHDQVNRAKLGRGNGGLSDEESGLYREKSVIQRLTYGDVALLKGELWEGNESAGLVHRSPAVEAGERRLLLTLDFG